MYKVLKHTCRAIVLPIRSFVFHVLVAAAVVVLLKFPINETGST